MRFLDHIFYRIYKFQFWVGNHLTPIGTTILGMTALFMFNLFSIISITSYLTGYHPLFFDNSTITALIFFVIILLVLSFLFLKNKRYEIILKNYKKESKEKVRIGNLSVLFLVVCTLVLLYFSLYILYLKNG